MHFAHNFGAGGSNFTNEVPLESLDVVEVIELYYGLRAILDFPPLRITSKSNTGHPDWQISMGLNTYNLQTKSHKSYHVEFLNSLSFARSSPSNSALTCEQKSDSIGPSFNFIV